jgi:hypothetical protein
MSLPNSVSKMESICYSETLCFFEVHGFIDQNIIFEYPVALVDHFT